MNAPQILMSFAQDLFENYAYSNKSLFYVDDNTYNIFYSDLILKYYKNAYVVHMVRDPRDVVVSFLNQRWTPSSLEIACDAYKKSMAYLLAIQSRINHSRFLTLRLEDLCEDPIAALNRVGSLFHFEFKAAKIDVSKSNTGRWKSDLNLREQNFLNSELGLFIRALGYDC